MQLQKQYQIHLPLVVSNYKIFVESRTQTLEKKENYPIMYSILELHQRNSFPENIMIGYVVCFNGCHTTIVNRKKFPTRSTKKTKRKLEIMTNYFNIDLLKENDRYALDKDFW